VTNIRPSVAAARRKQIDDSNARELAALRQGGLVGAWLKTEPVM
jgi:hypothetical protein